MKIYLFNTQQDSKHEASLNLGLSFLNSEAEVYSDYDLNITGELVKYEKTENLLERLEQESDVVLIATSATIFTAESLTDCAGAYNHFSVNKKVLLQLTYDNDLYQYPSPSLIYYGGRRLWITGNKVTADYPVLFGDSSLLFKILTKDFSQPLFNDGIFHGGDTTILSSLPPLVFNTIKELPVQVSAAAFDPKSYIDNIPVFDNQAQNISETISENGSENGSENVEENVEQ
jgi:hypothetical protein